MINKKQMNGLIKIKAHLDSLTGDSMFRTNLSRMRAMHHTHFFDPSCFACIIALYQYYHHLMGQLSITKYYETKGMLEQINAQINCNFITYKGDSIETKNKKARVLPLQK